MSVSMAITFEFSGDDTVCALIEAAVSTFDFTLSGEGGQSLGRDLAVRAATGIANRSAEGRDPDGNEWAPNRPDWAEYKLERYSVDRPGELGGQMLSLVSLLGKPVMTADTIEMTYGTGEPPTRKTSRSGVELQPSELIPTDFEKAEWFTAGGRRFYELDEEIELSLVALCGERLTAHFASVGL